jgi:hypothetical protein
MGVLSLVAWCVAISDRHAPIIIRAGEYAGGRKIGLERVKKTV